MLQLTCVLSHLPLSYSVMFVMLIEDYVSWCVVRGLSMQQAMSQFMLLKDLLACVAVETRH